MNKKKYPKNKKGVKRAWCLTRVLLYVTFFTLHSCVLISCQDILETNGTRDLFDKELNQKTDSMFMAYGILQSMQQLADQYVLTGEMRGDLTATTYYTNEHLRRLADFSTTTENKYDSAYTYYAVINNCNYYVAHRDTSLYTGSTNVVINEYAAVKAIRAWAYLMLARHYGEVPFFLEPLTKISDINRNDYPVLNMDNIVVNLLDDLEPFSGLPVPNYGTIACGNTNNGVAKSALSHLCFIPVDVILGEMCLETGRYEKAAQYYTKYLIDNRIVTGNRCATFTRTWVPELELPEDYTAVTGDNWNSFYENNPNVDIITYIPMSVNRLRGTVTRVPELFGYNYYITPGADEDLFVKNMQIAPSQTYMTLADSADYFYATNAFGTTVKTMRTGDMRRAATWQHHMGTSTTDIRTALETVYTNPDAPVEGLPQMMKYTNGNIVLYRQTTVYLHLAEALNRMGHYDLAFAILKDGIDRQLLNATYVSDASKQLLQTTYPFLSTENISLFDAPAGSASSKAAYGIHKHGCGYTNGNFSPYQLASVLGQKLSELHPGVVSFTRNDSIDAMEDLLCDEYAMEFAFEGTRYFDLCRLARHKNRPQWLADRLSYKHPQVDLTDERNWFLPLK